MDEFEDISNKAMLWNLLYEGGAFADIPEESFSTVKENLDEIISEISKNRQTGEDLKSLNKKVVQMMLSRGEQLRRNNQSISSTPPPTLVTSADISAHRQASFTNNLERRQQDFSELMAGDKPQEINFADKSDSSLTELDGALASLQARRNDELQRALNSQNKEEGAAWIQGEGKSSKGEVPKHIRIGEETPLVNSNIHLIANEQKVKFERKVRFSDEIESTEPEGDRADEFLAKLKPTTPTIRRDINAHLHQEINTNDLENLTVSINELKAGQRTIISLLSQLVTRP